MDDELKYFKLIPSEVMKKNGEIKAMVYLLTGVKNPE